MYTPKEKEAPNSFKKKKRRVLFRRKRSLDASIIIDYKDPEQLKRFITDRGKIIPRRISGATASQQRQICKSVKRARYIALLPFAISHRSEKKMIVDMALAAAAASSRDRRPPMGGGMGDRGPGMGDRGPGPGAPRDNDFGGDKDGGSEE
jgi:small subunit ribosomal protein S18